jgi:hypothetical protein
MYRQLYSIGGGAIKGTDLGTREGFYRPMLPGFSRPNMASQNGPMQTPLGILGALGGGMFFPRPMPMPMPVIGPGQTAIMPRLNKLGDGVNSAEETLEDIISRLETADSTLGSNVGNLQGSQQPTQLGQLGMGPEPFMQNRIMPATPYPFTGATPLQSSNENMRLPAKRGGIMNAVPRKGYFLGDIVDAVGDFFGSAADKVGDFVGSVADKVDLKDVASLAALYYGQPQLAANIQSMGGGTGNELLDTGLQLYSGSKGKGFPSFGMPQYDKKEDVNLFTEAMKRFTKKKVGGDKEKSEESTFSKILEKLLTPEGIASLAGGYLGYKDQKRVNEALKKRYEDFKRAEAEKYKQYRTGEGLRGMTVGNRTAQKEGTGVMGLKIRTNPKGVREIDYRENGGFVPPIGIKEKADDIPAMLSNNEFVFTADAVRGAGNGNVKEGAKKMYTMMKMYEGQV